MQQVLVKIENRELEKRLLDEANKKGRELANIILEILENNFLSRKIPSPRLHYKKLNPLKHISKIEYEIEDIKDTDLDDIKLFQEVNDSVAYVRELRKNAWRK